MSDENLDDILAEISRIRHMAKNEGYESLAQALLRCEDYSKALL